MTIEDMDFLEKISNNSDKNKPGTILKYMIKKTLNFNIGSKEVYFNSSKNHRIKDEYGFWIRSDDFNMAIEVFNSEGEEKNNTSEPKDK